MWRVARGHHTRPSLIARMWPSPAPSTATLLAEGGLDSIGEFFAPDCLVLGTDRDLPGGLEKVRKIVAMLRGAFSDLRLEVDMLAEAKDRVAWQRTVRASPRGDYGGFPATGRLLMWRDMVTSRFRGGLIADDWMISDLAERLLRTRRR